MAISAFYMHRRTVDHVLHRLVEIRRKPLAASDDDSEDDDDDLSGLGDDDGGTDKDADPRNYFRTFSKSMDDTSNVLRSYRFSSSMPNVVSAADWFPEDTKNRASSFENLQFAPLGLPSNRTGSTNGLNVNSRFSYVQLLFSSVMFLIFIKMGVFLKI